MKQTLSTTFRQCVIQKKLRPRTELFRIVRTKRGNIYFDPEYKIFGRGIHFSKDEQTLQKFFDPRKRGMLSHFLKISISSEIFEEIKAQALALME